MTENNQGQRNKSTQAESAAQSTEEILKSQNIKSTCDKHGTPMVTHQFAGMSIDVCDKCVEEDKEKVKDEQYAQIVKDKSASLIETRLKNLAIGRRFHDKTFENYEVDDKRQEVALKTCRRYAETFPERLEAGDSIVMMGKAGTGKNHLAASISKHVIMQGFTVMHTTALKIIREIKASWDKSAKFSENQVLEELIGFDLLVIDEVGVQFGSQTEQVYLMEIINTRYSEMKPTILMSNLDETGLCEILGEQVVSRFYEGKSSVFSFDWDDYRRKA